LSSSFLHSFQFWKTLNISLTDIRVVEFKNWREYKMDNVTLVRVVAGIVAVVILVALIYRMKKKAPR